MAYSDIPDDVTTLMPNVGLFGPGRGVARKMATDLQQAYLANSRAKINDRGQLPFGVQSKITKDITESKKMSLSEHDANDHLLLKMRAQSYAMGAILAYENWKKQLPPQAQDDAKFQKNDRLYLSAIEMATSRIQARLERKKGRLNKNEWEQAIAELRHFIDVLAAIDYPQFRDNKSKILSTPKRKVREQAIIKGESYIRWEMPRTMVETKATIPLADNVYQLTLKTTPVVHLTENLKEEWRSVLTQTEITNVYEENTSFGELPTLKSVKFNSEGEEGPRPLWFQEKACWEQRYLRDKIQEARSKNNWNILSQTQSATQRSTPGLANFIFYENEISANNKISLYLPSLGYSTFSPIDLKNKEEQQRICNLNMWQLLEYMGFSKVDTKTAKTQFSFAEKKTEEKQVGLTKPIFFTIPVETSSYITPSPAKEKDLLMYNFKCKAIDNIEFVPTTREVNGKAFTLNAEFLAANYAINGGRAALDSSVQIKNKREANKLFIGTLKNLKNLLILENTEEDQKTDDTQILLEKVSELIQHDVTSLQRKDLHDVLSHLDNLITKSKTPGSLLQKRFENNNLLELQLLLHLLQDYVKLANRKSIWSNKRHRQLMLGAQHSLIVTMSLQLLRSKNILTDKEKNLFATGHCQSDKDRHGEVRQTMVAIAQYFLHKGNTPQYDASKEEWAEFDKINGWLEVTGHTKDTAGESSFGCNGVKSAPSRGILGVATLSDEPAHFSPFTIFDKAAQESSWAAADMNRLKPSKWRHWKLFSLGFNITTVNKLLLLGFVLTMLFALPGIGQVVALGATIGAVFGTLGAALAPECGLKRIEGFILGLILGVALTALPFIGPAAALALGCAFIGGCAGAAIGRFFNWPYTKTALFTLAMAIGSGLAAGLLLPLLTVGASWLLSCAGVGTAMGFVWGAITGQSILKSMFIGAVIGTSVGLLGYFSVFNIQSLVANFIKPAAAWVHSAISAASNSIVGVLCAIFVGKTAQAYWREFQLEKEVSSLQMAPNMPGHDITSSMSSNNSSYSIPKNVVVPVSSSSFSMGMSTQ